MKLKIALCALLLLLTLAPPVQAQASTNSCGADRNQSVNLQSAVIAAGTHRAHGDNPSCGIAKTSTSVLQWTGESSAPPVLAGVSPTITWTATGFSGCTVGTISFSSWSTSAGSGSSADASVTMSSNECHGYILYRYKIIVSSVTQYDYPAKLPVNIRLEQPYPTSFDNTNRICAASALGASCTTPTINAAVTGSLTLSGTLDNLNRFCAASTLGSSCSTPTVNAVVSGTLDVLDRLCGASATGAACNQATLSAVLSGTVALSGTVNSVVSGTLDTLNRLCGASATGTACNQATINAVVSGTLDTLSRLCNASGLSTSCTTPVVLPCSTAAITADPNACRQDGTVMNGNSTNIISLPQPLRVQAVCTSSALASDPAACGTPVLTTGQNLMMSGFVIGLLYFLAILCSRFKEPAVNFFGAGLAAIAGFRAFDSAGGWLGGAMVIIATFTLCAWCSISGAIRIMNGTPLFERVTGRNKKSITDL